jgi:hypothetical protein
MIKKLPIGLQGFEQIRKNNFIYVDKTKYFYELAQNVGVYFLSRPRRFGKSLTLDTFKCLFEGKKELFKGLYIYDKWDWSKTYPVISISLNKIKHTEDTPIEEDLLIELKRIANYLNIEVSDKLNYKNYFNDLILNAYKKYNTQVVVLIDEYDKPILDNIKDEKLAIRIREVLKSFYEVLKDSSPILRFLFLTGVSKFTKTSIFSGLNNLNDITLDDNYSAICGYTQSELEFYFKDYLKVVDLNKLRKWYNGYFWGSSINALKNKDNLSVYNPFDILLFFNKGNLFDVHWFSTGIPEFLTKLLIQNRYFIPNLESVEIAKPSLEVFDVNTIDVNTLLFQTGYLTIKNIKQKDALIVYELSYPNFEVKTALNSFIVPYYLTGKEDSSIGSIIIKLYDALVSEKIDEVVEILKSRYASIPYSWFTNNKLNEYEGYYASVFYSLIRATGLECVAEDKTNQGRVDLSIHTQKTIYIIEFKVSEESKTKSKKEKSLKSKAKKNKALSKKSTKTSKTNDALIALKQILEKKYYEKYLNENKKIVLVGIEFSKKLRNIIDYKTKEI